MAQLGRAMRYSQIVNKIFKEMHNGTKELSENTQFIDGQWD
jgi:hypothetical protein